MKQNNAHISNNEDLVARAKDGNKEALNALVTSVNRLIYNLCLKMLWDPDEAKDASQEILIKTITHLSSFNGESSFSTWVYKIATNYLLSLLSKNKSLPTMRFDEMAANLYENYTYGDNFVENAGEQNLLVREIKIGCTNGMLQCLNAESRATYILGDILGFDSVEGAIIQNITPQAFRKRLSRARIELFEFMGSNCGIANPKNRCRCKNHISHCLSSKRIDRQKLLFAQNDDDVALLERIEVAEDAVKLFHSNPEYTMPQKAIDEIKRILNIEG